MKYATAILLCILASGIVARMTSPPRSVRMPQPQQSIEAQLALYE